MDKTQKTQEKIIKAAWNEVKENGFGGARMQRIADRAGVNKALLHYHFRNRELLLETVRQRAAREVSGLFKPLFSELPFPRKVSNFIDACASMSARQKLALELLLRRPEELRAEDLPDLAPILDQVRSGKSHGFIGGPDAEALLRLLLSLSLGQALAAPLVNQLLSPSPADWPEVLKDTFRKSSE